MNLRYIAGRLVNRLLKATGYQLVRRTHASLYLPASGGPAALPYEERSQYGPSNLEAKLERQQRGLPFELPDILNLNAAVVKLTTPAKRIVELGGGTGAFAYEAAKQAGAEVVCSEIDKPTVEWARLNRSRPNIRYIDRFPTLEDGPFDLVVSVEVVEHVADFPGFLRFCSTLADRALLTTPNRARGPDYWHAGPPPYHQHVREWTAGEFYWVLRCFYRSVKLYALTSQEKPLIEPITVDDRRSPLVADCSIPMRL